MGVTGDNEIILLAAACDDVLGACRDYFDNGCDLDAYS